MTPAERAVIDTAKAWARAEGNLPTDPEPARAMLHYDEAADALLDAVRKLVEEEGR